MWLRAPNLTAVHGFSTREGGVSRGAFASLNLSDAVGDDPAAVEANRARAVRALGLDPARVARLEQLHSADALQARPGAVLRGDALVTAEPGLPLAVATADCYPVLLEDPEAGVVGAAHAGWRGTVAGVVTNTLAAMVGLGARPERVRAAVGPGISAAAYRVGPEVRERFDAAGFPEDVWAGSDLEGEPLAGDGAPLRLDLARANAWLLERAGVPAASVWRADLCSTERPFFSYRRDRGTTGRMWAVVARAHS